MGSALPVLLALALAAQPPLNDRPTRPAVTVMALAGAALLGVGVGFELTGRAAKDRNVPGANLADSNIVGGLAMMGAGLCLITIAALLTRWELPALGVSLTPGGAMVALGAQWP